MSMPATNNPNWGFFGTIRHDADPAAWPIAMKAIARATGCPDAAVRDFLDSRHGRHFADDVVNAAYKGLDLKAAIERWMTWTIGRRLSRDSGIPEGLPYLTGFVTHFEILAEADAA